MQYIEWHSLLVCYETSFWGKLPVSNNTPLYRRRLVTPARFRCWNCPKEGIELQPEEVMSVQFLPQNGNICIRIVDDREFYLYPEDDWKVECYSPIGELVESFTNEQVQKENNEYRRKMMELR